MTVYLRVTGVWTENVRHCHIVCVRLTCSQKNSHHDGNYSFTEHKVSHVWQDCSEISKEKTFVKIKASRRMKHFEVIQ